MEWIFNIFTQFFESSKWLYTTVNSYLLDQPLLQALFDVNILWVLVLALAGGFLALARWIREQIRLATIRKAAGDKIVILVARFHGDKNDRFQKLLDAALCENLIQHGSVAVQSFRIPRRFSTEFSGARHEKAKADARKLLRRTNGDILVWGDDLTGASGASGNLFFVGRNRTRETFQFTTLDIMVHKPDLAAAFLAVVEHELTAIRDILYAHPEKARLDVLERLLAKYETLANSSSPALPDHWRQERARDAQRMRNELLRRLPAKSQDAASLQIQASEAQLESLDPYDPDEAVLWAETALSLVKLERRRAFYEAEGPGLELCLGRLERAQPIFAAHSKREAEAECVFERFLCLLALRETLQFPSAAFDAVAEPLGAAIGEFERYVPHSSVQAEDALIASAPAFASRLFLLYAIWHEDTKKWRRLEMSTDGMLLALERLRVRPSTLDPEAQHMMLVEACAQIFYNARSAGDIFQMRKAFLILDKAAGQGDGSALSALMIARSALLARELAISADYFSHADRKSFQEQARALNVKAMRLVPGFYRRNGLFYDLRLVSCFWAMASGVAQSKSTEHDPDLFLDYILETSEAAREKYPFFALNRQTDAVVALNNMAKELGRVEYAERAYELATMLRERHPNNLHNLYILSYAANQISGLIDPSNTYLKDKAALQAWESVQELHVKAVQSNDRNYIIQSVLQKRDLKTRFPSLFSRENPETAENGFPSGA